MILRPAVAADAPAIAAIYAHHVLHGTGTFEEVPPTDGQMEQRIASTQAFGLPWLVAEDGGAVLAYAYAAPFRQRAAYRYTAEDSVYVAPRAERRGLGRALLSKVIEDCAALGLRRMTAVIGDSANAASIGLHTALGFKPAGVLPAIGFKAGRWLDVVMMERPLNGGSDRPPSGSGLTL